MRRAANALSLIVLVCAILAPSPARADAGEEAELLSLLNRLRVSRGLEPLAVHGELRAAATDWAAHMAATQTLSHSPLNTRVTAGWSLLGENVGVDISVAAVALALELSPDHLPNLISPAFNYVGIGVAHGTDGGVYVVQDFMQLEGDPPPSVAPARRAPRPVPPRKPKPVSVRPSAPPAPLPPPPPPPPPPEPSPRLADVFGRLQGLDGA